MNEKRTNLEIIAPTVEEAIAQGLAELGLPEDAVEIEVLDEGTRGLFGLGTRQARVRLTIKAEPAAKSASPAKTEVAKSVEVGETMAASRDAMDVGDSLDAEEQSLEDEIAVHVAYETVSELLDKMGVRAEVTAHFGEPDDARSRVPLLVDVSGEDLSILIGPRAETLNALQFIASLIINKELGRSVSLVVDVQGYRARREQQIRRLARRMADQAIKTGRRQVLEPMPASERRLVHIELRENPQVTTESIGEDPKRKVTIIPK